MENILLDGLLKQRQLYLNQIESLTKKVSAIDMLLVDQETTKHVFDPTTTIVAESYPFNTPMSRRVRYVIEQEGEWKVDDIVKFIANKEMLEVKNIKPTITMTASALYKAGKIDARKEGLINVYFKKQE